MKSAESSKPTKFAITPKRWPEHFPKPSVKMVEGIQEDRKARKAGMPLPVELHEPSIHNKNIPYIPDSQLKSLTVGRIVRDLIAVDEWERKRKRPIAGLAAPQIGYIARIALLELGGERLIVGNMVATAVDEEEAEWSEGCASIPGLAAMVRTPVRQRLQGVVLELDGDNRVQYESIDRVYEGTEARRIRHEGDHLNGVLFPERVREQGGQLRAVPPEELPRWSAHIRGNDDAYQPQVIPWEYYDALVAGRLKVGDCQLP